MKKGAWRNKIKKQTIAVGTYKESFDPVIETLATILAERDETYREYLEKGAHPVVEHTNKNGSTNMVKNPLLATWTELNTTALSFWRDLGLTPAGLKKIDESAVKSRKTSALGEALKKIGG